MTADPPVSLAAYLATKQRDKPTPTHPHTPPPTTNGTHPYAAAALRDECADLAATPEGQRNHRLNLAAYNLGGLVGGGYLPRSDAAAALEAAARAAGLDPGETTATIKSGLRDGAAKPRHIPDLDAEPSVQIVTVDQITGEETTVDFWDMRPILKHIYTFALARMCSPWAVLGVVILRTLTLVPPHVVLPPTIGGAGSLNSIIALVGPSGAGKGSAMAAARDCIKWGSRTDIHIAPLGSGEGITHQYQHREKDAIVRDRDAVLFTVAEVDTLTAIGARQGSTIMGQLRSMWSGEQLGFAYADTLKRLPLTEHTYRGVVMVGVQPAKAGPIINDSDGGTPQRIVWLPATSAEVTATPPNEPKPWPLSIPDWEHALVRNTTDFLSHLPIPDEVTAELREQHAARARGEGDALDGHAMFTRLKLAAALAVIEGRTQVALDDWALAGHVMRISDLTRAGVQRVLAQATEHADKVRAEREAKRQIVVEDKTRDAAIGRASKSILKRLGGEPVAWSELRRCLRSNERRWYEDAIISLQGAGRIVITQDGAARHVEAVQP